MLLSEIEPVGRAGRILRRYFFWLGANLFSAFNELRRYGFDFEKRIDKASERSLWSRAEMTEYHRRCLKRQFEIAQSSPFWSEQFEMHHVNVEGDPFLELEKLPVLSKQVVKENRALIPPKSFSGAKIDCKTSGTTGSGLQFPVSSWAMREQWAVWWRYRERNGIGFRQWCGYFGGRTIKKAGDSNAPYHLVLYPAKQVMFSQYHLKRETVGDYIEVINKRGIRWLHGYPSFIALLASLAFEEEIELAVRVQFITLGAENVLDSQRRAITRYFGVEPLRHYGLAEGTANLSQTNCRSDLLVDEDFSFVEFADGEFGKKIIGTNFLNHAFPLFRYDSGDIASGVNESEFPRRVAEVDGRKEDYVTRFDGLKIGRLDHVFKGAEFISEAQIHQLSVEQIVVRVVPFRELEEWMRAFVIKNLQERVGPSFNIRIEVVDRIERTASGKFRFVISDCK